MAWEPEAPKKEWEALLNCCTARAWNRDAYMSYTYISSTLIPVYLIPLHPLSPTPWWDNYFRSGYAESMSACWPWHCCHPSAVILKKSPVACGATPRACAGRQDTHQPIDGFNLCYSRMKVMWSWSVEQWNVRLLAACIFTSACILVTASDLIGKYEMVKT